MDKANTEVAVYPKPKKPPRDKSHRKYRVCYNLLYDGGYVHWEGWYHFWILARLAIPLNMYVGAWEGKAVLYKRDAKGHDANVSAIA